MTNELSETRNGVRLPGALVLVIAEYVAQTLEFEDLEMVTADSNTFIQTVTEARQAAGKGDPPLPASLCSILTRWLARAPAPAEEGGEGAMRVTTEGGGAGAERDGAAIADAEFLTALSDHEAKRARGDMEAQDLTGTAMIQLSVSLVMGRVVTLTECAGATYASDPRGLELVRHAKKSSIDTLPVILAAKDGGKLTAFIAFISGLQRDLSERRMAKEAALVGMWLAETTQSFASDTSSMFLYLEDFAKKYIYQCRGLPTDFDMTLLKRLQASAAATGASKDELKVTQAVAKDAKSQSDSLRSEMAQMRRELANMKSLAKKGGRDDEEEPSKAASRRERKAQEAEAKAVCHHCGKKGHYMRNCPELQETPDEE